MIKITISDPLIALEAGEWCNEQFGEKGWDLWTQHLMSNDPKYKFEFFSEKDATLFGLRWLEHA